MKMFIKHILIFGVALLGFLIVCDAVTTYAFHKKQTRKYAVWNDILHTEIDADVLIMGNSRAWRHYSPRILDSILSTSTYNLGIDGSCFNRQLVRYDIYRHYQNKKPKCIVQNVEYFTLDKTNGYEREQFMPYIMYPYFRQRIIENEPFDLAELFVPMYRYYMNNFYEDYNKFDFPVYKGYGGEDKEWDGTELAKQQPYKETIDSVTYNMFIEYIEQTKEENIQLVLVFAPIYTKVTELILNHEEIHQLYRSLSAEYEIPFLDYSEWYLSSDTTYFYNAMHLNREGAELFSTQLAHDLDSLGIVKY